MKKYIKYIILFILTLLISISYCERKPIYKQIDKRKIENVKLESKINTFKESIKSTDKQIEHKHIIKDSIKISNTNTLERYNRDTTIVKNEYRDTLITNLVTEIDISDTIIELQDETIKLRDTVINSLEIINLNFKSMLSEIETELVKVEKKNKRKNIWIIISTSIAAILTIIIITS